MCKACDTPLLLAAMLNLLWRHNFLRTNPTRVRCGCVLMRWLYNRIYVWGCVTGALRVRRCARISGKQDRHKNILQWHPDWVCPVRNSSLKKNIRAEEEAWVPKKTDIRTYRNDIQMYLSSGTSISCDHLESADRGGKHKKLPVLKTVRAPSPVLYQ